MLSIKSVQRELTKGTVSTNKVLTFSAHIFFPLRETGNPDQQAVPQANHVDACKQCGKLDSADAKGCYRKSPETSAYDKHEEMRKAIEDEHYAVRKNMVESKREKSKHPLVSEVGTFNTESSLSRSQRAQPVEKNGTLSNSLNTSPGLVEQNGIGLYKQGFVSRPAQKKQTQRKNNMAHIEHWVKVQKGDPKRLVISLDGLFYCFKVGC